MWGKWQKSEKSDRDILEVNGTILGSWLVVTFEMPVAEIQYDIE